MTMVTVQIPSLLLQRTKGIPVDRRNNSSTSSKEWSGNTVKKSSNSFRVKVMIFFGGVWKGCGMMEVF